MTRSTEDGSISVAAAIVGLCIFLLMGLVLAQGQSLGSLSRTREVADNAARAGAQQIDAAHLLTTGEVRVDPALAAEAVDAYVSNLDSVQVTATVVDGPTVTVTVAETVTYVGPAIGWGGRSRTFTATESATALQGVSGAIE